MKSTTTAFSGLASLAASLQFTTQVAKSNSSMRAPARLAEIASRSICSTSSKSAIWSGSGYHLSDVIAYLRQYAPAASSVSTATQSTGLRVIDNRVKRDFLGIDLNNLFSTAAATNLAGSSVDSNQANESSDHAAISVEKRPVPAPEGQKGKDHHDRAESELQPPPASIPPPTSSYFSPDGYDLMEVWQDHHEPPKKPESSKNKHKIPPPILSHVEPDSGTVHMVDVSAKAHTHRTATAVASVKLDPLITDVLRNVHQTAKGNVLTTAELAGIMAAKQTSGIIPLCHHVPLSSVDVSVNLVAAENRVDITSVVKCVGVTGVEMEALTAVTVAALTVYDMCKGVSHDMQLYGVKLVEKKGGKSGKVGGVMDLSMNECHMLD